MSSTLRTAEALAGAGLIPAEAVDGLGEVEARYAVAVPPTVASGIAQGSEALPM